jgi:nonsense-mediated mRNA decay protein 3
MGAPHAGEDTYGLPLRYHAADGGRARFKYPPPVRNPAMFCVECGREGPTVGGLCGDCFRKRNPIVRPPEAVDAVACADCGRIETGQGWARVELETAIPAILRERIPADPRADRVTFTHVAREEDPRNFELAVKAAARIEGVDLVEAFRVRLRVKPGLCPTCTRRRSKYYEGILQVRAEGRPLARGERDRLVAFVEAAVARRTAKGEEVFIAKVEDVRGGADVYLSSNTAARSIARELADAFRGTLGASPKLYGRKQGKDLYRVTYLVRVPG